VDYGYIEIFGDEEAICRMLNQLHTHVQEKQKGKKKVSIILSEYLVYNFFLFLNIIQVREIFVL